MIFTSEKIQFTVLVPPTHGALPAGYSWQVKQTHSKAILLLLKSAFTLVQ